MSMIINISIVLAYYLTHPGISNQRKDQTLGGLPNRDSVGICTNSSVKQPYTHCRHRYLLMLIYIKKKIPIPGTKIKIIKDNKK